MTAGLRRKFWISIAGGLSPWVDEACTGKMTGKKHAALKSKNPSEDVMLFT
jgi:hypothetical protein